MNKKEREILQSIVDDVRNSDEQGDVLVRLFEEVKKMLNHKTYVRCKEDIELFSIVDFCITNHYNAYGGGVYLADAFKDLHDKYGWKYSDIHAKFKKEVDSRRNEVFITRTSDICLTREERKQLPLYHNQWYSHLLKIKTKKHKEEDRKDVTYCLSEPRELCKSCYNWLTQEDVGFNDFPGCSDSNSESRSYLLGHKDTCNRYCNM